MTSARIARVGLVLAAGAALLAGLSGGLSRLGLVPVVATTAEHHGALMVCGFFGTLIALERAAALGGGWALAVPGLSASGALLLVLGMVPLAGAAFLASGIGLLVLTGASAWRHPALFMGVMTVAAALWPIGTWWWLSGRPAPEASWAWLGFLILTITAERIELSRLAAPGMVAKGALLVILAVFVAAVLIGQPWTGSSALAGSIGALALWLLSNDVAVGTARTRGLARFAAACLLLGYGWMVAAAAALALLPPSEATFGYDAAVHALGIGFVLSMVFAHAPIILPAVTGARVRYAPALYVPVTVLQVAVAARVIGDVSEAGTLVAVGAWLTVASLVLYAATLAATSLSSAPLMPAGPLAGGGARDEGTGR